MAKTVVDVGNCAMDHESLRTMLAEYFQATLVQTHTADEACAYLRANPVDLLLVNRVFDRDQSDGLALIKRVKDDAGLAATTCMLISNYDEYQQQAVAAGAEFGFGKQGLHDEATRQRLEPYLA